MEHHTKRLILRPWKEEDAESLYSYAKDERVGPAAGWPVHTSVENSRELIRNVLIVPETYAVCKKEDNLAIGSIGLLGGVTSNLKIGPGEMELGFWIGVPFWGQGYIPEATRALLSHAFLTLHQEKIWCGYFHGNDKSRRAQEKCGFQYAYTLEDLPWPLLDTVKTIHVSYLSKEDWENNHIDRERNMI